MDYKIYEYNKDYFQIHSFIKENAHLYAVANLFFIFSLYLLINQKTIEFGAISTFIINSMIMIAAFLFFFTVNAIYFKSNEKRKNEDLRLKFFKIPFYDGDLERCMFVYSFYLLAIIYLLYAIIIISDFIIFIVSLGICLIFLCIILNDKKIMDKRKTGLHNLNRPTSKEKELQFKLDSEKEKLNLNELFELKEYYVRELKKIESLLLFEISQNLQEGKFYKNIQICYNNNVEMLRFIELLITIKESNGPE